MSGIVGIVRLDGAPIERELLDRMTARMAFRGPDGEGVWLQGNVGLGHTLLRATFESAAERQPLTLDEAVWIVSDGRIDGRAALIEALTGAGQGVAADAPDVDLMLHAYHAWGEACVDHLLGDFVFAIWDSRVRRLLCARDHFGVKPLYYARLGDELIFSNTLPVVRMHPRVSSRLNERAIGDFLLFGMNQDVATTTFADIQRLPPAHVLLAADGDIRMRRYWSLPEAAPDVRPKADEEYVESFRALFTQSVADRLRTTAVGTHLSGGMDASSVAVTAQQLLAAGHRPFDLRAYTIAVESVPTDEEPHYARLIADSRGIPIEVLSSFECARRGPREQPGYLNPEPHSIPGIDVAVEMRRRVAEFSRVLLTGFGGDPCFRRQHLYPFRALMRGHWRAFARAIVDNVRLHGRTPPLGARTALRQFKHRHPPAPARHWLNSDFAARLSLLERWDQVQQAQRALDQRQGMSAAPFWSNIFAFADASFTGTSIEYRFPFFDLRLLEYLLTVPPVPWFEGKLLLRRAMCDMLPPVVLRRPKTPLTAFPGHSSAIAHGPSRWAFDLARIPGLAEYADQTRLIGVIGSPQRLSDFEYAQIFRPLALGYWLHHLDDDYSMNDLQ